MEITLNEVHVVIFCTIIIIWQNIYFHNKATPI